LIATLTVSALNVALGGAGILHDINLSAGAGEFIGLVGPNGAGKSTLMRTILGLTPTHGGSIVIAGADIMRLSTTERARRIAYLAQDRDIAWPMSVEAIVALGRAPHRVGFGSLSHQDIAAIDGVMARLELDGLRGRRATALSGGERARVLIARALAQDAPLLLADEPTAGLDPAHQIAVMEIFASLAQEGHVIIASLHDLGLAARWCSRIVLIDSGRIVADGAAAAVLTTDRLRAVYGVEAFFGNFAGAPVIQPVALAGRGGGDQRS
jgi:iron complex transport system ATP-binding protein